MLRPPWQPKHRGWSALSEDVGVSFIATGQLGVLALELGVRFVEALLSHPAQKKAGGTAQTRAQEHPCPRLRKWIPCRHHLDCRYRAEQATDTEHERSLPNDNTRVVPVRRKLVENLDFMRARDPIAYFVPLCHNSTPSFLGLYGKAMVTHLHPKSAGKKPALSVI